MPPGKQKAGSAMTDPACKHWITGAYRSRCPAIIDPDTRSRRLRNFQKFVVVEYSALANFPQ